MRGGPSGGNFRSPPQSAPGQTPEKLLEIMESRHHSCCKTVVHWEESPPAESGLRLLVQCPFPVAPGLQAGPRLLLLREASLWTAVLSGSHTDVSALDTSRHAAGYAFPMLALDCAERQWARLPLVLAFSRSISKPACPPLLFQGCIPREARLLHYSPAVGLGQVR